MASKKVLSFSLWGSKPHYNIGAIKNAELAKEFYPDFECWFYIHKESVPLDTIEKLKGFSNCKIIFKSGDLINENCKPRMWRFESIDDPEVEIMMSRDTDTRILLREKLAVDEWLNSKTLFHIMRDHPHHDFVILAGMFGSRKIPHLQSWIEVMNTFNQDGDRMYDQNFLKDYIYPVIRDNSIIHTSFHIYSNENTRRFPIEYCSEYKFVGEYVYEDESRSLSHVEVLKTSL